MASKFYLCMITRMEEGDMWHYNHLEHSRTLYPSIFLWDLDLIHTPR
jgi:hypothetical protein